MNESSGFGVAQVHLKPRKSQPFFARHPWVFDAAIAELQGTPQDGDVVDLISDKGRFIARGLYNSQSRLRVRLYTWNPQQGLGEDFFRERLRQAIELRRTLGLWQPGRATRLVYSEGDGLSGVIVDAYDRYLVVQLNSQAMTLRWETQLQPALVELFHPTAIVLRSEKGIAKEEGMESPQGVSWGTPPDGPVFIEEHGLRYGVDLLAGQKTGFYCDQRDNRWAAAQYVAGRSVLDLFCYSGAFSLAAAVHGKARSVLGIDTSERAITLARANAELNGVAEVQFRAQECFAALDELSAQQATFGAVFLDPPKFTRSRQQLDDALRAYFRINRLAVDLLEPGGILVTCSCSGNVSSEDFRQMLATVSQKSGRDLQILEQRGASPDHPVSATCPETAYLKCFICRVSN